MKEYNVQLTVRNNCLLTFMRERGINTAAELSRATGVGQQVIGEYLNLKTAPMRITGVSKPVQKLCNFFCCEPEDLFPTENFYSPLAKNKAEVVLSIDEVTAITSGEGAHSLLENMEKSAAIEGALNTLTDRQRKVLTLRMGIEGKEHTLREVGDVLGVTAVRVREIEQKALRRLRHPNNASALLEFYQ